MANDENIKLPEMVDLALCTPEVGTVNFNILRILLHEMLKRLGIDNATIHLGDLESNHVQVNILQKHSHFPFHFSFSFFN